MLEINVRERPKTIGKAGKQTIHWKINTNDSITHTMMLDLTFSKKCTQPPPPSYMLSVLDWQKPRYLILHCYWSYRETNISVENITVLMEDNLATSIKYRCVFPTWKSCLWEFILYILTYRNGCMLRLVTAALNGSNLHV